MSFGDWQGETLVYDYILVKMSARSPRKIFLGTEDVHLREAENALFFFFL